MSKYLIYGGNKLDGKIDVCTSKNATLPILAGSILANDKVVLNKLPNFTDVFNMIDILKCLGVKVEKQDNAYIFDNSGIKNTYIPNILTKNLRASIFMLGPMLAKLKRAKISFPGGCNIGTRPIDLHLKGLRALNVKIIEQHGYLICDAQNMIGNEIYLDFPSVGATENLLMASIGAKGTTKIRNCAKEPEIVDLQNFLNKIGAKIYGAGTETIIVEGVDVEKLSGCEYTPISDRIIAGTYLLAGAITGGNVEICGINPKHLSSLILKLRNCACNISIKSDKIMLKAVSKLNAIKNIQTAPYPGFPTDLQPQIVSLLSVCEGTSVLTENLFETRFKHIPELIKMGADIEVKDKNFIIHGVKSLSGAEVVATDLRAGAGLVLAGLCAKGYTIVDNTEHINRGYENLAEELNSLNAIIKEI